MFQKYDPPTLDSASQGMVAVFITLTNDEVKCGHFLMEPGKNLSDLLNGAEDFIELRENSEATVLINKKQIKSAETLRIPRQDQLEKNLGKLGSFDAYQVLGVNKGASAHTIKIAYHSLVRLYHPDRFSGIDMPKEMVAYANAMLQRINMAYKILSSQVSCAA